MKEDEIKKPVNSSRTRKLASFLSDYRFVVLLSFMVLFLVTLPVLWHFSSTSAQRPISIFTRLFFAGMLIAAVFAVSQGRRRMMIAIALAIPTVALQCVPLVYDADAIFIVGQSFGIVFLLYVVLIILRDIFTIDVVRLDTICASICVYFLLGIIWALGYSLLEFLQPHSFVSMLPNETNALTMQFSSVQSDYPFYYSFVTMTTAGYGDIVPANATSRMLSVLQALTGQLYLVVLVARLVGLHIAHSTGVNTQTPHGG